MTRRTRATLNFLVLAILFGLAFGLVYVLRWASLPKQETGEAKPVRITIASGETVATVADDLEKRGLIRSSAYFRWIGRKDTLKPGVYLLAPTQRPEDMLVRFVKGKVDVNKVTFPEGFTIKQMATRLKRNKVIENEEAFYKRISEQGKTLAGKDFPNNLEGYLFPDTYLFPLGAEEKEVVEMMAGNFHKRVVEYEADLLKASGRSLDEIIIVASLIEREAEVDEDRPKIASVIYNRLKKNMRLQIDATVQYARGLHKSRLMYSDLEIDSPYNTYKVAGLPPGPICCPGIPSIRAAMEPADTNYLFYVDSGDGTGKHVFATTYAEHQKNVAQYRKKRDGAAR